MTDFDKPREACGIFGICGHPEAAPVTYFGLYALQHRGQEKATGEDDQGDHQYGFQDRELDAFQQRRVGGKQ